MWIHCGQAGLQIGEEIWSLAASESSKSKGACHTGASAAWFHRDDGKARMIAVDTEPKTLDMFKKKVPSVRSANVVMPVSGGGGCGNNWSMGFNEEELAEATIEAARREGERSSWFRTILLSHSTSGGTGSGLGSRLLQALRDNYPSIHIMSACVAGFHADTPLQWYNTAFTLQYLTEYADATFWRSNEDLLRRTPAPADTKTKTSTSAPGMPSFSTSSRPSQSTHNTNTNTSMRSSITMSALNKTFARDLVCYLDPSPEYVTGTSTYTCEPRPPPFIDCAHVVCDVCPCPKATLVDIHTAAGMSQDTYTHDARTSHSSVAVKSSEAKKFDDSWKKLAKKIGYQVVGEPRYQCLSAHVIVRGGINIGPRGIMRCVGASSPQSLADNMCNMVEKSFNCPKGGVVTTVSTSKVHGFMDGDRSIAVCSNRSNAGEFVANIINRAQEMFDAGAYKHWYHRHGLEDDDFMAAFEACRLVADTYTTLAGNIRDIS